MKTNSLLGLCGFLLFASIGLHGCGEVNNQSAASIFPHQAGWAVATTGGLHPAAYQANQTICVECHGSAQDSNSSGGISGVSCFSTSRSGIACHPAGPSGHPAGWDAPGSHGAAAKAAAPGLGSCGQCHGADFAGGAGQSCKTCHSTAPHPAAPWRGTTASATTHTTTDTGNAAECARCHLNNQRLSTPQPVPAGTTPGCFNNTLCHGAASGHPTGWSAASSHGTAAKAVPGAATGLASCTQCHGSDFVSSATSCKSCHTTAPHPVTPWRGTTASGTTHTTTDAGNAAECARCHLNNQRLSTPQPVPAGTTPGCSNNTLCHGAASSHPAGWSAASSHGAAAKAATPGLNSCGQCHGTDFTGGSGQSCLTCHSTAPHPPRPWFGGTTTHSNTDTSNASACAACHTNRANLSPTGAGRLPATATIGTTGCFDNTLCHGVMGHTSDPQPWSAPANHGARAKLNPGSSSGFSACQQCHGTAFNTDRGGSTCFSCHTTAPHPIAANWRAIGVITHTNTGTNNAPVCSICHNSSAPNLVTPYSAWFTNSPAGSFKGGSPDCFTASLCHGDVRKTSQCDACHSIATTAPFKSMSGATATSDTKVGAHVKHLSAAVLSANIPCSECHTVPGSPEVSGTHRNGINNIAFGTLAQTGSLTPVYTTANGVCTNTYCHGATLTGGGSSKMPVWNQPGVDCGTCHGNPPSTVRNGAAAHSSSSACNGCHTHVNSSNNGFTVAGVALHVNGSVEASAGGHNGAPYPGATHRSASTAECFACHPANIAGSPYPATSGTPPNCRGCHLNADPSTDPHCSDCHGDLTTGRPNGSIFPNRQGEHRRSDHINRACTDCHPFSSGDLRHGWSDRQKSTAAQVGGAGTEINSWNSTTKSCSPSCHGTETW